MTFTSGSDWRENENKHQKFMECGKNILQYE